MGRKPKHPEHKEQAEKHMNELLDSLVSLWTSEKNPQLNKVESHLGRFCLTPFANGRSQQEPFPVTFKWGLKMTIYFGKI